MFKPLFPACRACKTAPVYKVERLWLGLKPFEPLQCCEQHRPGSHSAKPHDAAKFYNVVRLADHPQLETRQ